MTGLGLVRHSSVRWGMVRRGKVNLKEKKEKVMVAKKNEKIEVRRVEMEIVNIPIWGVTSLISHNWSDEAIEDMERKQMGLPPIIRGPKNPEQQYRDCLYVIDEKEKRYGFPSDGIKKAMVQAGGRLANAIMTKLRTNFFVLGDLTEIISKNGPSMRRDMVRLGGKTADIRYRAEFKEWRMIVGIKYFNKIISQSKIVNLLYNAGLGLGLGDWRPERGGTHGMWRMTEKEEN